MCEGKEKDDHRKRTVWTPFTVRGGKNKNLKNGKEVNQHEMKDTNEKKLGKDTDRKIEGSRQYFPNNRISYCHFLENHTLNTQNTHK